MERRLARVLLDSSLHISQFRQIHALIITHRLSLISTLTHRLLKAPFLHYARQVFDRIPQPDHLLCNSFISAYTRASSPEQALGAFLSIHRRGVGLDSRAIPPTLKSCASLPDANVGKQIHSLATRCGLVSGLFAQTALMDFYAKSGDLGSAKLVFDGISAKDPISCNCLISAFANSGDVLAARKVFDEMTERTVASWNSIISCYSRNGDCPQGLRMFEKMRSEKCRPNEITLVTVLSMCAKLGDLEMGLKIKKLINDNNLRLSMIVSTAILEMFVKCGNVDEARQEFERMNERDIVAWSAMIAGYAGNGMPLEALDLFERMKNEHIKPNDVAIVSVLSACVHLGSVEKGVQIGNYVECHNLADNIYVATALLDMYSKCGNIKKARRVFDRMPHPDIVALNSMIAGLSYNGFAKDAIALYGKLVDYKLHPDEITFVGLLNTCAHAGLVDQGLDFFRSMREDHGIKPKIEHYACMVDLFCRSGRLDEAYEFICGMEIEPNVVIWGALLSACRAHQNAGLAELSIQKLLHLEPENSGNYVLLSNLHATAGRWEEALKLRDLMKDKKVQKIAAYSWLEVGNRVHKFLVGDTMHPKSCEIYGVVDSLTVQSAWACHALKPELEFSGI